MAYIMRYGVGILNIKHAKQIVPRLLLPARYQRLCFHTSWILNVKGKELLMPSLSPTMEDGTIVKWLKKEGDKIESGDALVDIQTDKAVMTLEFDDESILAKIIVPDGKNAKIGQLIALTVETDEDWKSVEMPSSVGPSSQGPSVPSSSPTSTSAPGPNVPPPPGQTNIPMPSLSPTMCTGTIVKWFKKEGETLEAGDALVDIQTDKAVMTFESDEEGVLAKILLSEGGQAEIGDLIAVVVEKGFDLSKVVIPSTKKADEVSPPTAVPAATSTNRSAKATDGVTQSAPNSVPPSGQVYGLAVKRLLEEYGLSSGSIKGTGRVNRLLKEDVLTYIQSKNLQKLTPKIVPGPSMSPAKAPVTKVFGPIRIPKGPSTYKDGPVSNIRATIAKRLSESKTNIPHSYASIDINLNKLTELRKKLRKENIKVSVNDFVIKAVAHALLECPGVNTLYENGKIVPLQKADISVAVSTPTGLITPIVFNAAAKGLSEISNDVKSLAGKAREGKLQPNEFQGGSFTVSNLGMFGIKDFSAIINPPQTAILAVGTGRTILDENLNSSTVMSVTLSYDRRAIDEVDAADFLQVLEAALSDPSFLALGRLHGRTII